MARQSRALPGSFAASALLLGIAVLTSVPAFAQIETVVVTAERRAGDLQRTPITMTVVTAKQLDAQNVTTTTDLLRVVPSLSASDEGVYQIRSVGTRGFGRSAEQSVSVVLDGVVLGRALTNSMYDLDHVEVLSGPQGTLFGKNATAGVINVVTHAPVLGEYSASIHADAGDHDYIHSYIIGNIPLGDQAALRVSYHHDTTGHIVYNTIFNKWDYNADDGVRGRLLWEPTSNLTINLSGDYQKLRSNGVNGVADFAGAQVYTFAPANSQLEQTLAACGIVASKNNNRVCQNSLYAPGVDIGNTYGRWNAGGALQVDYNWDGYLFTSITALRQTVNEDFNVHADIAGEFGDTLPQNILDRNLVPYFARTWSEEFRVASPADDPINFVAGVYYSKSDTHDLIDQTGAFGLALGGLEFRRLINMFINQQNYAAFGQVNWQATDALKVFVGGRITHDDNSDLSFNSFPAGPFIYTGDTGFFSVFPINSCTIAGGTLPYVPGGTPCPAGTDITTPGTLRKTGLSGKAGVQYQVNEDTMIFASIARGYKGPFMNESASYLPVFPVQPLTVKSEYPTDVELGVKTTVLERFALNVSLFTAQIDQFQTTVYIPPPPGVLGVSNFIQANAKFAITRGIEATLFGNVTDELSINAGLMYDDAHFDDSFRVSCVNPPTNACPAVHQLPFAPAWKASVAGDYHRNLWNGVDGFVQGDLAYSGWYPYTSTPGIPGSPPRYLLGLRAGVRADDSKWDLAVFCRNCLDKRYPINIGPDGFAGSDGAFVPVPPAVAVGPGTPTYQFLTIDSYRVVGVTLDYKY